MEVNEWRQTAESVLLGPNAPTQDRTYRTVAYKVQYNLTLIGCMLAPFHRADVASQLAKDVEGNEGVYVDANETIRMTFDQIPRAILDCIQHCRDSQDHESMHQSLSYWINLLANVLYRSPLSKAVFDCEDLFREVLEQVADHVRTQLEASSPKDELREDNLNLAMYAAQLITFSAPMMTAYSWESTLARIAQFVDAWNRCILRIVQEEMEHTHSRSSRVPDLSNTLCILRNYFSSFSSHELLTGAGKKLSIK